jgi:hypothetical protein
LTTAKPSKLHGASLYAGLSWYQTLESQQMNKPTQVTIIEVILISFGLSLLFTSLMLVCALLWMDALFAGLAGFLSLALVYLLNRY